MSYDPSWIEIEEKAVGRRRGRRSRNRRRRPMSAKQMAATALSKAMQLERYMEDKYFDAAASVTSLDRDGVIDTWNAIPQGDTDITRDGDYLYMKNIEIRASVWHDNQTGQQGASAGVRFIVFYDKQNTISTVSDLLDVSANDETNMLSPIIWDVRKQVEVIMDVMVNADGVWKERVLKHWQIKLDKQTQFTAGSTTITTGALKVVMISDRSSVSSYLPQMYYYYRIIFKDA
jgi:hypothetical protein